MIIQPPSVICMGSPGSGKTYALATLLEAGLETFVITTEPDGLVSLLDAVESRKAPIDNLHWASCLPATPGWSAMSDMISTIGSMGFESIQNIKTGVGKSDTRKPAMKLLENLQNFKCERTGKAFGDVTKWNDKRVLVLDSLSGLSMISWMLTLGYKPAAHQGEWGVAMNFVEQLLLKLSSDRSCFFVITSHIEKELNEITGVTQIMASTLGRKLAPKIPKYFSEFVYAKRVIKDGKARFSWATLDTNADLKNRSLPISTDLEPDYRPVVAAYRRRLASAGLATTMPPVVSQETAQKPSASAPTLSSAPMKPQVAQSGAQSVPKGA